jgi:hypothetical protein
MTVHNRPVADERSAKMWRDTALAHETKWLIFRSHANVESHQQASVTCVSKRVGPTVDRPRLRIRSSWPPAQRPALTWNNLSWCSRTLIFETRTTCMGLTPFVLPQMIEKRHAETMVSPGDRECQPTAAHSLVSAHSASPHSRYETLFVASLSLDTDDSTR